MGQALAEAFPVCRETFDEADAALGDAAHAALLRRSRGRAAADREHAAGDPRRQHRRASRARGARACSRDWVAGHSLGEYSANVAAGTFCRFADARRAVRRRGRYMQEAVPVGEGAMAAILGLDCRAIEEACARGGRRARSSAPANLNAPGPGRDRRPRGGGRARGGACKARGRQARACRCPCRAPFHCALMKPAEERLAPELRALAVARPARAGRRQRRRASRSATAAACREALVRQVSAPVRWEESVRAPCVGGRHNVC